MINIIPNGIGPRTIKTESAPQKVPNAKVTDKKGSFDQLLINSTNPNSEKPILSESQFANALKKQISTEVNKGASEIKLNDLKRQNKIGELEINPAEIVKKLLIGNGDK